MLMALGQFVFGLHTLAFQSLQRQTAWRHAQNSRVGARAASQFLGAGDDTITLPGVVLPEFGSRMSLDELHTLADAGQPLALVDGNGRVYGQWVITEKSETASYFSRTGEPARIEFSVSLRRVDDNIVDNRTTPSA
jgi:phage protein U